jgi:hypothetical protein
LSASRFVFRDPKSGEYRALDAAVFAEIAGGTVRF